MKLSYRVSARVILLIALSASSSYAQQEFTQTVTRQNTSCNATCSVLDVYELNNNPKAIILVTPVVGNGANLNPHPIGAYYTYLKKWSIVNLDQTAIAEGAKFKVQYFLNPGPDRFVYIVPQRVRQSDVPYIDHAGLNDNPNAQIRFFPTGSPTNGALYNKDDIRVEYDATVRKWYIANINNKPMPSAAAYNIVISSGGAVASDAPTPTTSPPITIITNPTPTIPTATQPAPIISTTPALPPMARPPSAKSIQLAFDNLNDFVAKGLPASAPLPTGNLDQAAVIMARQISRSDENSLPVLLAALQTAGFSIIDENGKVLKKPPGDGKGQGLAFYDFEAVGALKLANHGLGASLDKMAGFITKDTPQISASQFSALMLQELRTQVDNSENAHLRFWARLIIELGKSSAQPNDLMTASPGNVNVTILQASLLVRRLQGDFYTLKTKPNQTGKFRPPFSPGLSFTSAAWKKEDMSLFRPISWPVSVDFPCNLTNNESLILDAAANLTTTWSGWQIGQVTSEKVGAGLFGVNLALAWLKLTAAVTMLHGEITVENAPLIRTINSTPGEKRLMKARIWSEVGRKEMLNCLRPILNALTGLDFNLPSDGPLSGTAIEWHFAGDNETRVNDAGTRNSEKFVVFESLAGKDKNPQNQVTDDDGISPMYLVGAPKVPEVGSRSNVKVPKTANVLVGVTMKSAKNPAQQFIDIGGGALGIATSGPLGILMLIPEIGYRVPLVPAHAEIPVTDHEPCDGQWHGTITYTYIVTLSSNQTVTPPPGGYSGAKGAGSTGSNSSRNTTITQSGTVTVDGFEGQANSSADEIGVSNESSSGKQYCHGGLGGPKGPLVSDSSSRSVVSFGGGNSQGKLSAGISLDKDGYQISIKPLTVNGTLQSTTQTSYSGGCPPSKPSTSYSNSSNRQYGSNDYIIGKGKYGADRNILSGSDTKTISTPPSSSQTGGGTGSTTTTTGSITTVATITWNLRRCN